MTDTQQHKSKAERERDNKEKLIQNKIDKENQIRENENKKLQVNDGIEKSYSLVLNTLEQLESIKDIDEYWINKKYSLQFISYLPDDNLESASSQESLFYLNSDVSKLLKFKYNVFWSHVLLNKSLQEFLDSFLSYFQRYMKPQMEILDFDSNQQDSSKEITSLLEKLSIIGSGDDKESHQHSKLILFKRVFFVILRISMQYEKRGSFLTKEYYAKVIHNNQIFTIPKLFDIASIYIPINKNKSINEIYQRIFDIQPLFYKDLTSEITKITKVLDDLKKKIFQTNIDLVKLDDSSKYINDIFYTLDCFMKVYPTGTHTCYHELSSSKLEFIELLVTYYSVVLKYLQWLLPKSWTVQIKDSFYNSIKSNILSLLNSIFRHLFQLPIEQITSNYSQPCSQCSQHSSKLSQVTNEFLLVIGSIINNDFNVDQQNPTKSFIECSKSMHFQPSAILLDYDKKYNLSDFLVNLRNHDKSIDETQLFIILQFFGKKLSVQNNNNSNVNSNVSNILPSTNFNMEKINSVKELFSDYGNFYLHSCLKFYNDNVEQVINALCDENSLPPHLKSMDKKLEVDPKAITTPLPTTTTTTTTTTSSSDFRSSPLRISFNDGSTGTDSLNRSRSKIYITRYEEMYNDDYDDSLEEFTGVLIQDGESLNTCDEDELDNDITEQPTIKPQKYDSKNASAPLFITSRQSKSTPSSNNNNNKQEQKPKENKYPSTNEKVDAPKSKTTTDQNTKTDQPQQHNHQKEYKKKSHNQKDSALKKRGIYG